MVRLFLVVLPLPAIGGCGSAADAPGAWRRTSGFAVASRSPRGCQGSDSFSWSNPKVSCQGFTGLEQDQPVWLNEVGLMVETGV